MTNLFRDGFANGVTETPRPITPEQEEAAARKLERSRALRAEKRAAGELAPIGATPPESADTLATGENLTAPMESEAVGSSVSSANLEKVSQPLATSDEGMSEAEQAMAEATMALAAERADLEQRAEAVNLRERYNYDAHTSIKGLRMKVADAELEAGHAARATADPMTMPDDAEYQAAKLGYQRATANVNELQAVEAGLPGRVQDAVNAGDFAALAEARQRQSLIGAELEAGRFGALRAELAMQDAWLPLLKAERTIARVKGTEAAEAIRKAQQDAYEAMAGANDADTRYSEVRAARGDTLFRIDTAKQAMLQAPPAQHRAPHGLS